MTFAVLWAVAAAAVAPCEGVGATVWGQDFRDRVLAYDALAAFAVAEFGQPIACDAEVTSEFDGAQYGALNLTFSSGVSLAVETQPIETSIVTLRSVGGFDDPTRVEFALRDYTAGIGVSIDWTRGEADTDGGEAVTTFRDPDDGLNASAQMRMSDGRLVAVRFSMAL